MTTTLQTTGATPTISALDAARRLAPELDRRAPEGEALGTLPADLVGRIRDAGLFRVLQARALGGMELDPASAIEVFAELCHADGSAGWAALIGAGGSAFASWLDPAVAVDLFGADADFTIATVFAPTGRARPEPDGRFTVSGRWPFASGCRHAEWFLNGAFVFDGDAPRMLPDRGPDWRLVFMPATAAQVVGNWDVLGLRGTGSNEVVAENVVVAEEHTICPFSEAARQDGALWRLPFMTLAGIALVGFPLGVGRRALDEIALIAPTKARTGTFEPLANDVAVQVEFARAEGAFQAARAFVFDAVGSMWDTALAGYVPSLAQRSRFQLAAIEAMRCATGAVDTAFALAGSSAVYAGHPLQRAFRDVHTAAQHAYFSPNGLKQYSRIHLGVDAPTSML